MAAHKREFCTRGHSMSEYRKFHPNGDSYCSACKVLRGKEFRKKHPDRMKVYQKNSHVRRLYGVEPEKYKKMLDECQGKCMLCGTEPQNRSLHVDHDHTTGKVRGLLCHHCNTALGLFRDDIDVLEKAIQYVRDAK